MQYLYFKNGDAMPALGLGTWKSDKGEVYKALRDAFLIGYRHIDCALFYGNEPEIGQAFGDALKAGDIKREELFVTSKLWNNAHLPEHVQPNIETSLRDLQLDYLDLYLIHWPVAVQPTVGFPQNAADMLSLSQIPLATTWQAMVALKENGLARHIGVSNFSVSKIEAVSQQVGVMPEANQVEAHPFFQQPALLDYCKKNGILFTSFCPLGSADRPASRIHEGEPHLFADPTIKDIAIRNNISQAQVMLAWAVQRGGSTIPKSVNPQRLKENLAAADIKLSATDMALMATVNQDYRYIKGNFWCLEGSDYTFESLWG
jgi:alcohol dehydrogenase (NADP+)